jgi:hypothetical protein
MRTEAINQADKWADKKIPTTICTGMGATLGRLKVKGLVMLS